MGHLGNRTSGDEHVTAPATEQSSPRSPDNPYVVPPYDTWPPCRAAAQQPTRSGHYKRWIGTAAVGVAVLATLAWHDAPDVDQSRPSTRPLDALLEKPTQPDVPATPD